jgi:hypothetical protein
LAVIEKLVNNIFSEREYKYIVPNKQDPKTNENLVRGIQKIWFEELFNKNISFSMFCIFGEFKCLESIKQVLENENYEKICNSIEVIFGDQLYNQTSKKQLKELLQKHQNKFHVYQKNIRPTNHKILIENKLMVEDDHSFEGTYEYVMVSENISKERKKKFFDELKAVKQGTVEITLDNIDQVHAVHDS